MIPAKNMKKAFDYVKNDFENLDMLLVPNALITLPIIR
jgi:hypothetical protein